MWSSSIYKKVMHWWSRGIFPLLQDFISPTYCTHCWKLLDERVPLCSACKALLRPVVAYDLVVNSTTTCTVHALSSYEEPIKLLIRAKQSRSIISSYQLGHLMAENMVPELTSDDVLVPIPLHWQRYAWRGFNQAHIIATVISQKWGASVIPLVKRIKNTEYQAEVHSKEARHSNVKAAFCWDMRYDPSDYVHKRLIVIDDLMTTGSTLCAVVNVLSGTYTKKHIIPPLVQAYVVARVTR